MMIVRFVTVVATCSLTFLALTTGADVVSADDSPAWDQTIAADSFFEDTIELLEREGSAGKSSLLDLTSYMTADSPSCVPDSCLRPTTFADASDATGCDHGAGCFDDGCLGFLSNDEPLLKSLRNQTVCGDVKYSVGGELRYRYLDEQNRLRPQGTDRRDTYQQWRFTPFLQVGNDWITGYVQAIDAPTYGEDIPILPIDENRWDLLQYYVDAKLLELDGGDLRGRYGRMFLKYGDQHLISPLGWSNTFRVFEGGKLYYSDENWDVDGFVVRPSNGAASPQVFHPESFDQADQSILFSGVYATYKQLDKGALDLYWLWNKEDQPQLNRQDGNRQTIGMRWFGTSPVKDGETLLRTWLWDTQGGYQFGADAFEFPVEQNVQAGFLAAMGGVTLDEVPWSPTLKGVFWYGSGDDDPTDGTINTVYTLYPLGHAYWGLIDNFNGANLLDYSVQVAVKPTKKLTLESHYHWFDKASANDFVYNIAGAPLGNTTTAARHLGNELDLVATYQVNANLQLQTGYFWFWYGDAIDDQPTLRRDDAHTFYFMTTWGF